jgi:radial spoke head protein 4A
LAKLTNASSLRFWGKMLATKHDYFVVEGTLRDIETTETPFGQEPRGKGCNKCVYWVTDNILEDWVELPDVNPDHIIAAKQFKKILSGNLNATVDTSPPFPGKERHLLRAQIARIGHATILHPKGQFENDEDKEDQLNYVDEFPYPALADLNSNEAWGHLHQNILGAGRITHQRPNVPDEEAEDIMAKLEEDDKVLEKLMGINEDLPIKPLETAWLLKIVGDDQPYNPDGEEEGTLVYAGNVIKSLRWPGAATVSYDGRYTNIYVGYGLKHGDVAYNPTSPPDVQADPSEVPEMPEPTPLEAPEEPLEPDTDEDKKGEGEGDE